MNKYESYLINNPPKDPYIGITIWDEYYQEWATVVGQDESGFCYVFGTKGNGGGIRFLDRVIREIGVLWL